MVMLKKPSYRPNNPNFSSGPCSKRPGWTFEVLKKALVGRSHRSRVADLKLAEVVDLTREVLEVPFEYRIGIVPAFRYWRC
ncbi:phosphoserine aminotransferase [Bartonella japonica]|uniref:Phosphoserine aminotransferase n=1 Tax=Bartonella japonica TaxID=357761 RepID=A0ABV2FP58_9HYPH